jgi:hypothetical protein
MTKRRAEEVQEACRILQGLGAIPQDTLKYFAEFCCFWAK